VHASFFGLSLYVVFLLLAMVLLLHQEYEALPNYISIELAGSLSEATNLPFNSKLDALFLWAGSLGLRNPSQRSFRSMLAIYLQLQNMEITSLQKHDMFHHVKQSWRKILPVFGPTEDIPQLPASPETGRVASGCVATFYA